MVPCHVGLGFRGLGGENYAHENGLRKQDRLHVRIAAAMTVLPLDLCMTSIAML